MLSFPEKSFLCVSGKINCPRSVSFYDSKEKMLLPVYPVLEMRNVNPWFDREVLTCKRWFDWETLYTLYTYLYIISPARYGHDNVEQDAERDDHANNETPCLHHLLHIKTNECNKKCFFCNSFKSNLSWVLDKAFVAKVLDKIYLILSIMFC